MYVTTLRGGLRGTPAEDQAAWDALATRFGQNMAAIDRLIGEMQDLPTTGTEVEQAKRNTILTAGRARQQVLDAWSAAGVARGRSMAEALPLAVTAVRFAVRTSELLELGIASWPSTYRQLLMRAQPYLAAARDAANDFLNTQACLMPSLRVLPGVSCPEGKDPYSDALRILAIGGAVVGGLALLYVAYPYLRDLRKR